jgi:hypothetical protein
MGAPRIALKVDNLLIAPPAPEINVQDQVGANLTDGVATTDVSFTWTVSNTNRAPEITESDPATVTMSEDGAPTPFGLTLHATDADGDDITWSISSDAANGTAAAGGIGASMDIGYAPDADFNGADSFVVQVSDGNGGTDVLYGGANDDVLETPLLPGFSVTLRRLFAPID